ncbi:MAG: twin-arginine translocase subunit TatC [Roseiflexus sp.]|jgi:sec-independent protein translocase protein TatC|nr:twin-arginine translocase subunit TatC [Roseiflexus sp.]MBO9336402.1 twin-arginine translocase subunit TatC [Roseiflexus sp.]MBO9344083.1 twin-arginine translocase subunit TatC [Roseiflexus sp.]MBO9366366.1 twin-arginine translocase subunit TatC [Roseiflexus sp.]MBO9384269.1 twin-arginine translocase subunit TatC [Roseiflexus sp.]
MEFSSTQLIIVVGVLTVLILLPLLVILLVRVFIKDEVPVDGEEAVSSLTEFTSIGDIWRAFVPHLVELRDRLVKSLIAIAIGTIIGFWIVNSPVLLGEPLPVFLVRHLAPPGTQLQGIDTGEVFFAYMRMALVVGITLAMPFVLYQIVAFFLPGLLPHEKRVLFIALPFVTELFIAGVAFGWFFTVPAALGFLLGFGVDGTTIITQPRVDSFIGTVATLLLWNGLIFQLPAIVYVMARLGVVTAARLASTRRYAIIIIFIIAAFITPTGDPYNLLLLAIPMYLLYELGIILARFVPKRRAADEQATAPSVG